MALVVTLGYNWDEDSSSGFMLVLDDNPFVHMKGLRRIVATSEGQYCC